MPCYHPLTAYRGRVCKPVHYGGQISFDHRNKGHPGVEEIQVPCGQCIGCRLERSRQWAIRCVHEASLHEKNCFITLTYDEQHLPENGSLNLDDIQKFMKKLRSRIAPERLRFFQCGEYGTDFHRPHHHCIIFGYDFPDKELFFKSSSGCRVYRSPLLEDLWEYGFSSIGDVTFESAAYVARYCLKKVTGDPDSVKEYYGDRKPEFVTMSRRPGIAAGWLKKFEGDIYPKDYITLNDGMKVKPAKYYDRLFDKNHHEDFLKLKAKRKRCANELASENSPGRLFQREECQKVRLKQLRRDLEV